MITPETLPTRYEAGTASVTAGQTTVTQTDAAWFGNVWGDDLFFLPSQPLVPPQRVAQANEDGTLTLAYPWPGATATNVDYEVRYVGMIERSTAQSRRVLEQLGEVSAYYDVQVNTLADRAAFDNRPAGYRVLVSNIGDGRAAIYSKLTSNTADWSAGATLGEIGPEGPVGPIGITWRGSWDNTTAYAARDGVLFNGSSWRAKQANSNQSPPALPAIENAYWHLVAQKGTDGSGTGDVVGPGSSASGRIALFSGTTGKLLQQAGVSISDLQPAGSYEPARAKATQGDAELGAGTAVLGWAPQQIVQAILARAPSTSDLEFTVSQLALAMADALNVAQFLGSSGNRIADSFDALTYVDVAGATNLDVTMPGALRPTKAGTTVQIGAPSGTYNPGAYLIADLRKISNGVVVSALGVHSNTAAPGTELMILRRNSAGNYTVMAKTGGFNHPGTGWFNATLATAFQIPSSGDYYVGVYNPSVPFSATSDGVSRAYVNASNPALNATFTASEDSAGAAAMFATRYVHTPLSQALTVASTAFVASSAPSKMKALMNVKKVDASIAGTDYTLECSRDGGTTWSAMTLVERYTMPSGLTVVEGAETSVGAQPSGSSPRWRFKTLNNKNVELHDVYLYWS